MLNRAVIATALAAGGLALLAPAPQAVESPTRLTSAPKMWASFDGATVVGAEASFAVTRPVAASEVTVRLLGYRGKLSSPQGRRSSSVNVTWGTGETPGPARGQLKAGQRYRVTVKLCRRSEPCRTRTYRVKLYADPADAK